MFDALQAAKLVPGDEKPPGVETPQPQTSPPPTEREVEAGAILIALLGKRAMQIVEAQLPTTRNCGYQGAQYEIRKAVERVTANRPVGETESLTERMNSSCIFQTHRAGNFDDIIEGVHEALRSGASEKLLAKEQQAQQQTQSGSLAVPSEPQLTDDEVSSPDVRRVKLAEYEQAFTTWRNGRTPVELKSLKNPDWNHIRHDLERKWEARAGEIRARLVSEVIVKGQENLEGFVSGLETLYRLPEGGYEAASEAFKRSPRSWEVMARKLTLPMHARVQDIEVAPPSEWVSSLQLPAARRMANEKTRFQQVFREQIQLLIPTLKENEVFFSKPEGNAVLFLADGTEKGVDTYTGKLPEKEGVHASIPGPNGWFELDPESGYSAKWRGPAIWKSLQVVRAARRGTTFIEPAVAGRFSPHPAKDYPRLYWEIGAGAGRASFELPIQRWPGNTELSDRLAAIAALQKEGLGKLIPDNAFWMDCAVGKTKNGNPRLDAGACNPAAAIVEVAGRSIGKGRHGRDGATITARETGFEGGTQVLWNRTVFSHGGGAAASCVVAFILEGESVPLSDGTALSFNGSAVERVAGGGLAPGEDPTQ
ncbi:MAG: hypothetical protein HYW65_00830 [Candidatus Liptonbacteria bacterium]|nr:hypothetical protein [Candidatus Liptonbacteria bacterium]